jgi:adenine phosphoribosyltransferase
MEEIKKKIREIPDFPKPGILFYDITTLLKDPTGLRAVIDVFTSRYQDKRIRKVLGIESRGFIIGPAVACNLGAGFVPIRKPGKLPAETLRESYELEYGTDTLEVHKDSVEPGERVLIIDDLIATGGTAGAAVRMAQRLEAEIVECAFLVELEFLEGRQQLPPEIKVFSALKY